MTDLLPEEREILLNHLLRLFRMPQTLDTALKTKTRWSLDNYPENLGRPALYVTLIDDLAANESLADLRLVMVRGNQITPPVLELDEVLMAWKARAVPRRRRDPADTARDRARRSERRTSQTLLHCRIIIDPVNPDEANAAINARFSAMVKRMAGCARRPVEAAVSRDDGFLVRFRSPVDAVKSGLMMQRATIGADGEFFDPNARVSFGLSQAELFAEQPIPLKETSVEIASVLASLGEHQQLLVTGAVFGSVSGGAALELPDGTLGTAEHGDYEIAVLKRLVNVCELADLRIRQTSAPEGSGAAHSAQRPLETAGFFDLVAVTRAGTSIVYYGKHTNWPDTDLAIKVLTGGQQLDQKARDAFLAAARLLKGKELPGVVKILDFAEQAYAYFVMEWIEGDPLLTIRSGRTTVEDYALAFELCDALIAAHDEGIIHGDIKPANVLINEFEHPVLIDFGLPPAPPEGESENVSVMAQTPAYLAPELIEERVRPGPQPADRKRADLYSLGLILYEMFVGKSAFPEKGSRDVLAAHVNSDPRLPRTLVRGFDPRLEAVLMSAIERNPDNRYESVAKLKEDLTAAREGRDPERRPAIYDNGIQTRASAAVAQIKEWKDDLTRVERDRLMRAFDPLLRTGLSAIGESRLTHWPIVMLYAFGALIVSSLAMLLTGHSRVFGAEDAVSYARLGVGVILPVITGGLWWAMSSGKHLRAAFVMGVLTVMALPLAVTNTLHELLPLLGSWSVQPKDFIFGSGPTDGKSELIVRLGRYANWQIALGLLAGLAWAALVSQLSRTVTMAVVSAMLLAGLLLVLVDLWGWLYFFREPGHADQLGLVIALILAPLSFAAPFALRGSILPEVLTPKASRLSRRANANEWRRLTPPFVVVTSLFLLVGATVYALNAGKYVYVHLIPPISEGSSFDAAGIIKLVTGLLVAGAGVVFYAFGQHIVERWFSHVAIAARTMTYLGIAYVICGLLIADDAKESVSLFWWPRTLLPWTSASISLGVVLAVLAVVWTFRDAVVSNSKVLMTMGIAAGTIVAWYIEVVHFQHTARWAYFVLAVSALAFSGICLALWRRRVPDIDDMIEGRIAKNERRSLDRWSSIWDRRPWLARVFDWGGVWRRHASRDS